MRRIEVQDLSRTYGRSFALHQVNCHFEAGTLTAVLGNNGAGKTTLLNILATLESPTRGTIHYDKVSWPDFARGGRHYIGWVSHDTLLYEELTGPENLRFYAQMYGVEEAVQDWLERVGLGDVDPDKRVHAYSRGMRQRLTLARALLHNPSLVLLDEPMTGLDQSGRQEMVSLLEQLKHQGKILVLITHDLQRLDTFVDQLAVLRHGRLSYFGEVAGHEEIVDMYHRHA